MFRLRKCRLVTSSLIRNFGKNKRPRYASGKKFPKDRKTEVIVNESGRRVKHFADLKFYHAKNKYGQNQTLVDSRRRDIDFFNPITGGYDRDPRSRYEASGSDGDSIDEEAAAFADFTDTDDEDIYFGGGNDEDGDYDDEGNELRPKRAQSRTSSWADSDPISKERFEETDLDEDEREFDEVFGKQNRQKSNQRRKGNEKFKSQSKRRTASQDFDQEDKHFSRKSRNPDPELGIDFESFTEHFKNKKRETKPILKKDFSAEEFLKSSDLEGGDSDFDEEKAKKEGEEEMEEFNDVFNMMREYDRPSKHTRVVPITERMVAARKKQEMNIIDEYDSDDVEIPNVKDPRMQQEIAEEHEENIKRLKSTPGGRKTLKALNAEFKSFEEFPPCGKELYEGALDDGVRAKPDTSSVQTPDKGPKTTFVDRDSPLSKAAKGKKKSDSWRTLNLDFDDMVQSEEASDDVFSDLKAQKKEQEEEDQIIQEQHRDLGGRSPFGATGVRYFSTSVQKSDYQIWCEESVALRYAKKLKTRFHVFRQRQVDKQELLQNYWKSFPSDQAISDAVKDIQSQIKHPGRLYVAMLANKNIVCGIEAPRPTIGGNESAVDQFQSKNKDFVKVDLSSFRRLVQRGEIITGGPPTGVKIRTPTTDWTGTEW